MRTNAKRTPHHGARRVNKYTQHFRATCPRNNCTVDYRLTIESTRTIMVEDIQEAVGKLEGFHEDHADKLLALFGGRQTLVAHHHGTDIETTRP